MVPEDSDKVRSKAKVQSRCAVFGKRGRARGWNPSLILQICRFQIPALTSALCYLLQLPHRNKRTSYRMPRGAVVQMTARRRWFFFCCFFFNCVLQEARRNTKPCRITSLEYVFPVKGMHLLLHCESAHNYQFKGDFLNC